MRNPSPDARPYPGFRAVTLAEAMPLPPAYSAATETTSTNPAPRTFSR